MVQEEYDKAAVEYEQAFKRRPSQSLVLRRYQAMAKAGKLDGANQLLEDWLREHPKDTKIRLVLASRYQLQQHEQKAITHYEAVLKLHKDHPAVLNNLAWLYEKQNDPRALDYAEQAHQAAPNNGSISDTLGWLYLQRGETERGLEMLRRASAQAPNVPDIQYHLAVALVKMNRTEEARRKLKDLLASNKDFSERSAAEELLKSLQ
jgi:Tfp pilus assembly protein PilF